jgi:hypothetical protein
MAWDDYPRYTLAEFVVILIALEERAEEERIKSSYYIASMVITGISEGLKPLSRYLPQKAPPKKEISKEDIQKAAAKYGVIGPR